MLTENKFSKYLLYAIGEIILVVIGILIALQLNINKENKEKSDLGYKYLTEMKKEVQDDIFMLDGSIRRLKKSIKNQETALKTKSIAKLPLDSLSMIISPINLDLNMSELTFNRMKNLGLTALSNNDSLNSQINNYYNSDLMYFKRGIAWLLEMHKKHLHYIDYEQELIDYTSKNYEFPALYSQSKQALDSVNRINIINYITSLKGRNLVLSDLGNKRYALGVLNGMQERSVKLFKSIYKELKIQNPKMEPLPLIPSEIEFKKIELSKELLTTYTGKYLTETKDTLNVILDDKQLYVEAKNSEKGEIFPYAEDKFFVEDYFVQIEFNREKGRITSFTTFQGEKKIFNFKKLD